MLQVPIPPGIRVPSPHNLVSNLAEREWRKWRLPPILYSFRLRLVCWIFDFYFLIFEETRKEFAVRLKRMGGGGGDGSFDLQK